MGDHLPEVEGSWRVVAPESLVEGRLRRRLLAKVVLLSLVGFMSISLSACGASDEEQIEMTVKRFNRAAAEGDGQEACDQLTSAARTPAGGLQCESAIDQLGKLGGEQTKRRLAAVEVRNVKVDGDRATAEAQIPTQTPATLQLEKVSRRVFKWKRSDGDWKIASLGSGIGGGF
jgi:hypothetical protein